MPYKDPEKERQSALERKKRYRQRQHEKRYGSAVRGMCAASGAEVGLWRRGNGDR